MALPGLLIEYLISGTLALVWLVPAMKVMDVDLIARTPVVLLPAALYLIGMGVDFAAFWLVQPVKGAVRNRAWKKYSSPEQKRHISSVACHVRFALYAPELAKEAAMRASRDRIARGAIVNVVALIICAFTGVVMLSKLILIALLVVAAAMWVAFEYTSYGYEVRADHELTYKLIASNTHGSASTR